MFSIELVDVCQIFANIHQPQPVPLIAKNQSHFRMFSLILYGERVSLAEWKNVRCKWWRRSYSNRLNPRNTFDFYRCENTWCVSCWRNFLVFFGVNCALWQIYVIRTKYDESFFSSSLRFVFHSHRSVTIKCVFRHKMNS